MENLELETLKIKLQAAEKKIKELEAKLWVAKDSALRTYDGLADKADKYDEANEMLEKMATALSVLEICDGVEKLAGRQTNDVAKEALKQYEEWKKR